MAARSAACPPESELADFGLGRLRSGAAETIAAHLETCDDCRQMVAAVSGDSFVERLKEARDRTPDQAARKSVESTVSLRSVAPSVDSSQGPAVARKPATIPPELASHADYELIKELGRGGMGVVYLARNRMMDRLEVLKVVNKAL